MNIFKKCFLVIVYVFAFIWLTLSIILLKNKILVTWAIVWHTRVSDLDPSIWNWKIINNFEWNLEIQYNLEDWLWLRYSITDNLINKNIKFTVLEWTVKYNAFFENDKFNSILYRPSYRLRDIGWWIWIWEEAEFDCIKLAYDLKWLHKWENCKYIPTNRALFNWLYENIFIKLRVDEWKTAKILVENIDIN